MPRYRRATRRSEHRVPADPDAGLGVAYILNKMGHHLVNGPREKELRDAVYRSVAKLGPVAKDTPVALVG